jgi:hypothetical protein
MHFEKILDRPRAFKTLAEACAHLAAMEKIARERPDLIAKFSAEGESIAKAAADAETAKRQTPRAVEDFEALVSGIAKRDGIPKHAAMERACEEHPRAFTAY